MMNVKRYQQLLTLRFMVSNSK